jgi:cob(I)alamin adenosyltransferase
MKIYTRHGDDGTTGLFFGGRVAKDSLAPAAYGDMDEAQSVIGVARAEARAAEGGPGGELDEMLIAIERDLWVAMAELATSPQNRHKLKAGATLVTAEMVVSLERLIDDLSSRFEPPKEFTVPGQTRIGALLDVARTVVRRCERASITALRADGVVLGESQLLAYLNRLSDLLWTMARWQDGASLLARER